MQRLDNTTNTHLHGTFSPRFAEICGFYYASCSASDTTRNKGSTEANTSAGADAIDSSCKFFQGCYDMEAVTKQPCGECGRPECGLEDFTHCNCHPDKQFCVGGDCIKKYHNEL